VVAAQFRSSFGSIQPLGCARSHLAAAAQQIALRRARLRKFIVYAAISRLPDRPDELAGFVARRAECDQVEVKVPRKCN
jgi:hypothetical protein